VSASDVTINLKDLKALLGLCLELGADVSLRFDKAGLPLLAVPHLRGAQVGRICSMWLVDDERCAAVACVRAACAVLWQSVCCCCQVCQHNQTHAVQLIVGELQQALRRLHCCVLLCFACNIHAPAVSPSTCCSSVLLILTLGRFLHQQLSSAAAPLPCLQIGRYLHKYLLLLPLLLLLLLLLRCTIRRWTTQQS
jgi:hypothetical protein